MFLSCCLSKCYSWANWYKLKIQQLRNDLWTTWADVWVITQHYSDHCNVLLLVFFWRCSDVSGSRCKPSQTSFWIEILCGILIKDSSSRSLAPCSAVQGPKPKRGDFFFYIRKREREREREKSSCGYERRTQWDVYRPLPLLIWGFSVSK